MRLDINMSKMLALVLIGVVAMAVAAGGFDGANAASSQKEAEKAYKSARNALNADEFREAAEKFKAVYEEYTDTKYASRSLYWQAYSLYKIGGKSDLKGAQRALEVHLDNYSDSGTQEDAAELYYRVLGQLAKQGDAEAARKLADRTDQRLDTGVDTEIDIEEKMAALQALVNMRSDKALPLLEKLLSDTSPENAELREKSLFLISQHGSVESVEILMRVAKSDPDPDVRKNALFWLSQTHSKEAAVFLEDLLQETDDPDTQEKVIFALSQIGDDRALAALRKLAVDKTQSENVRANAIFWLGQGGGLDDITFLKELYGELEDEELKERVIFSVSQGSRNGQWLLDIVNDEKEPTEVRKQALFWAGQSSAIDAEGLARIYKTSKHRELREQAVFALSQRHESEAIKILIELAKAETDPDLRKQLVFWIGQSGDPAAEEFLLEIINN